LTLGEGDEGRGSGVQERERRGGEGQQGVRGVKGSQGVRVLRWGREGHCWVGGDGY